MAIVLREIQDANDAAIAEFGRLQRRVYFEAEALIPGEIIGHLLHGAGRARRNFLLVAEDDGVVVAGTFFHYLDGPNTGFSSFMGVAPEARGQGLARRLHERRFEVLDRAAVSAAPVQGVFIDVTAPERLGPERVRAERVFGYDPFARREVFRALGFGRVDLPYAQPVGGPGGGPLTTLDLLYCARDPHATQVALATVLDSLRAYWSPWLGRARTERALDELARSARSARVALVR